MTTLIDLCVVMLAVWLVARTVTWLPVYYAREESAWIAAARNAPDASSVGDYLPEASGIWPLWQEFFSAWPPLNRLTAIAGSGVVLLAISLGTSGVPAGVTQGAWFLYGCVLLILALVDYQTKLLPDILTIPMIWLGLVLQLFPVTTSIGLEMAVVGAVVGYVPLWVLAHVYRCVRRRDGLGMGDLKLLAAMGAWSGPWVLPQVILLGALFAILWFVWMRIKKRGGASIHEERPFGPWLVLAYLLMVLVPIR